MIAAAIFVVIVLVIGVLVAIALRRVVLDDAETDQRLLSRGAHTVSFAVPNGVDVADLRAAASRGGFVSTVAETGTDQRLLVECENADRARLRRLLEEAHDAASHDAELHLDPVVFDDERPA